MSRKSNNQGRGYEYACLITLYESISKYNKAKIVKNNSHKAALRAWETLTADEKNLYKISAEAGIFTLLKLEPLITEPGNDEIILRIQADNKGGEEGDIRDILISRNHLEWEIGLSIKHNHFAVKHSRLSKTLDFGEKWYGIECSETYWQEVGPVFQYLADEKSRGKAWRELPDKENDVYVPILNAFKNELIRQNKIYGKKIPRLIAEYLLGQFDFYKIIGIDNQRITKVQGFNLRGTLNKNGKIIKRKIELPKVDLPERIIFLDYKPGSKTTLELYFDCGWQLSFRIHNASSKVEPSLKFDVQITGMPTTLISIDCRWRK